MIEFDVDMGYLLEEGELDRIILNDENCEHEPMCFAPERTCQRVLYEPTSVLVCSECGAGIPKQLDKYCFLRYCPSCGAKVVEE